MIFTKYLEDRINIDNVNEIFSANVEEMLLNKLKKKYINRCFHSIYILNIIRIIKHGAITCKAKSLDGGTYCDINFEVEGIVYEKNEVIHNCKINKVNKNILHAKAAHTALQIKNTSGLDIYKEGNVIPVIVNISRYNLFSDEISVSAEPFLPAQKNIMFYQIGGEINKEEISFLINDITNIKKQLGLIKNKSDKLYKYFVDLIFPFKKDINYEKEYKAKKISILDMKKIESLGDESKANPSGKILFQPNLRLDDDSMFLIEAESKLPEDAMIFELSLNVVIQNMLNEYKKNLFILLGFLTTYDSPASLKEHIFIFKAYESMKK